MYMYSPTSRGSQGLPQRRRRGPARPIAAPRRRGRSEVRWCVHLGAWGNGSACVARADNAGHSLTCPFPTPRGASVRVELQTRWAPCCFVALNARSRRRGGETVAPGPAGDEGGLVTVLGHRGMGLLQQRADHGADVGALLRSEATEEEEERRLLDRVHEVVQPLDGVVGEEHGVHVLGVEHLRRMRQGGRL